MRGNIYLGYSKVYVVPFIDTLEDGSEVRNAFRITATYPKGKPGKRLEKRLLRIALNHHLGRTVSTSDIERIQRLNRE